LLAKVLFWGIWYNSGKWESQLVKQKLKVVLQTVVGSGNLLKIR